MKYSAPEIQAAFESGNTTTGYKCRTYSTDAMELVHFQPPSQLISVKYDCWENVFIVKFEKYQSAWGDYVTAIAKTIYTIMRALQAGGLDVTAPASADDVVIKACRGEDGWTRVSWGQK